MSQLRHFAFTWNNYVESDLEKLNEEIYDKLGANYLIYAKEKAPTTGTLHLQGYMQLSKRKTFVSIQKIFEGKVHITSCKGSSKDNIEYCSKPENEYIFTKGTSRDVGRTRAKQERDWQLLLERAENNDLESIKIDNPRDYIIYYNTFQRIANSNLKPEAMTRYALWIWGKPGTGKSRFCHQTWPDAYWKNANKWWDGYTDQKVVVLDDLGTDVLCEYLKRWADRYKIVGEIKGGSVGLSYETFVVTSNFHPNELFQESPEATRAAILRRFQIVEAISWEDTLIVKFDRDEIRLAEIMPMSDGFGGIWYPDVPC